MAPTGRLITFNLVKISNVRYANIRSSKYCLFSNDLSGTCLGQANDLVGMLNAIDFHTW